MVVTGPHAINGVEVSPQSIVIQDCEAKQLLTFMKQTNQRMLVHHVDRLTADDSMRMCLGATVDACETCGGYFTYKFEIEIRNIQVWSSMSEQYVLPIFDRWMCAIWLWIGIGDGPQYLIRSVDLGDPRQ